MPKIKRSHHHLFWRNDYFFQKRWIFLLSFVKEGEQFNNYHVLGVYSRPIWKMPLCQRIEGTCFGSVCHSRVPRSSRHLLQLLQHFICGYITASSFFVRRYVHSMMNAMLWVFVLVLSSPIHSHQDTMLLRLTYFPWVIHFRVSWEALLHWPPQHRAHFFFS